MKKNEPASKTDKKTKGRVLQTKSAKKEPGENNFKHENYSRQMGTGNSPGTLASILTAPDLSHPVNASQKAGMIDQLHETYGNSYLQAKLKIGQPNDKYEQEADRIADQIMRMPEPGESAVEKGGVEKKNVVQTKSISDQITPVVQTNLSSEQSSSVTPQSESNINALRGGGQPLSESTRSFFEPRFGADFSSVRLHTDSKAAETAGSINAKAFTIGRDIVLGEGQFSPGNSTGKKLLAHELAHTLQQNNSLHKKEEKNFRHNVKRSSEVIWEENNKQGRVEKISDNHWVFWNFPVGKSILKSEFDSGFSDIAGFWKLVSLHPDQLITIEGHTSDSGNERSNKRLSRNRAYTVMKHMAEKYKIPGDKMNVAFFGENKPWFPNISPLTMARNRRVDVKISYDYTPSRKEEKKQLTPPEVESPGKSEPPVTKYKKLSNIEFSFQYEIPWNVVTTPLVTFVSSGEIQGTVKLGTGSKATIEQAMSNSNGKVGLIIKQKLSKIASVEADTSGKIGVKFEYDDAPLHPEIVVQLSKTPVSFNLSESLNTPDVDLGGGLILSGKVTIKAKFGMTLGPSSISFLFGSTTGIVLVSVSGGIAATIGLLYLGGKLVDYSKEQGRLMAQKIAHRTSYAWRIACEATGNVRDYNFGVDQVKKHKKLGNFGNACEGWIFAERCIKKIEPKKDEFFMALKKKLGKYDVTSIHDAILLKVGGVKKDNTMPPSDLFMLLR